MKGCTLSRWKKPASDDEWQIARRLDRLRLVPRMFSPSPTAIGRAIRFRVRDKRQTRRSGRILTTGLGGLSRLRVRLSSVPRGGSLLPYPAAGRKSPAPSSLRETAMNVSSVVSAESHLLQVYLS